MFKRYLQRRWIQKSMAAALAGMMILSNFIVLPVSAEENGKTVSEGNILGETVSGGDAAIDGNADGRTVIPGTYILNASDIAIGKYTQDTQVGDAGYFTIRATTGKGVDVEANSKKFTVDEEEITVTNRIKTGGAADKTYRCIAFTIGEGKTGDITVCAVSSDGSIATEVALFDADGNVVDGTATGIPSGQTPTITWQEVRAGSYYVGTNAKAGIKNVNFYYLRVIEKEAGTTIAPPTVTSITAALAEDGKTAVITLGGTAGAAGSEYVAEYSSNAGAEWKKAGSTDGSLANGQVSVDLSGDKYGTGTYQFRAYGAGTTESIAMNAAGSIAYTLPLGKPVIKTATAGDAKITVTWDAVREADSYTINVYKEGESAAAQSADTAEDIRTYEFTGLTNGQKYLVEIIAKRSHPLAEQISDKAEAIPYVAIDKSNAVPGMNIVDQNEAAGLIVLRENGNITAVQPASSGGVSGSARTNLSFVQWPTAMQGDFTVSADVTISARSITGTGGGIFIGGVTSTEKDGKWMTAAFRGDTTVKAYIDKPAGSAQTITGFTNYKEGSTYTLETKRVGDTYIVSFKDGDAVYTKEFTKSAGLADALWGEVYPVIALAGVSADISNIVIMNGDAKVFDSETLTGIFTPFADNWESVSAPVLSMPTVDNEAQTITVACTGEIGVTGAGQITVEMYDESGEKVGSAVSGTFNTTVRQFTFTPEASGTYTFKAVASRAGEDTVKTSQPVSASGFVMKLTGTQVSAANKGNGSVKLNWNKVKEADGYHVYYKAEGSQDYIQAASSVQDISCLVTGLTIGTTYTFKVMAVRNGVEAAVESTVVKTVEDELEPDWYFSAFGQGVSLKSNGYSGSANDGAVTVWSLDNKGKLVPASTDGLAFYYTEIPSDKNFTLTAKVTVDNWTFTNAQEGFGLMAADTVGENGNAATFWNNSYMAFSSKVEYFWDTDKQSVSDTGDKITMKLGIGSQEKAGVTAENREELMTSPEAINQYFKTQIKTLETSCAGKGAGTYNIIGNYDNKSIEGTVANPLTEMTLTIQKNNTGYFVSYTDAQGNVTTNKYYDTSALSQIDKDTVYAGFFASRTCKATFSDVKLTIINPEDDAPAEVRPITKVTPSYQVVSAATANSAAYDLTFISNADGKLTIKKADGTVLTNEAAVEANAKNILSAQLTKGKNDFTVTFVPNADYKPSEFEVMASYEPVTFNHSVQYTTYGTDGCALYVSPEGSAAGNGTKASPLDIYTAVKYVRPGQTIVLKGGTYSLTSTVKMERGINGSAGQMISMVGDPESAQRPVFDFNGACAGMIFAGDYWYCRGFDVTNSQNGQKGIQISGSYSTFVDLHTYHNGNTGIQVSRYLSTDTWDDWPSHDLILNCTSYGNADAGYEDADGFAAKLTVGDNIVFDGCIAYNNADDGWDLFAKPETGAIGSVRIENSIAYGNGYLEDGTVAGNGNGFKLGGSSIAGKHVLVNSFAFNNKAKGIDSNSCPDIQVSSCTSFNNGSEKPDKKGEYDGANIAFYTNDAANTDFGAQGILSFRTMLPEIGENIKLKGTQDDSKVFNNTNYYWDTAKKISANASGTAVDTSWFKSLVFNGITRNADGLMFMQDFLSLTEEAPEGVGAKLSGRSSGEVQIPAETDGSIDNGVVVGNDDDDDDDDSGSRQEPPAANTPVSQPSTANKPKPVKKPSASQGTAEQGKTEVLELKAGKDAAAWKAVTKKIEDSIKKADGTAVVQIEMKDTGILPKQLLEAIQGKDVKVTLDMGEGIAWTINGKSISAEGMKDIDFTVTKGDGAIPEEVVTKMLDGREGVKISLAHDGSFGFEAKLNINVAKKNSGQYASLFYYNEQTKELEFMGSGKIDAEGNVILDFNHASDYLLVIAASAVSEMPKEESPAAAGTEESKVQTGDKENISASNNTIAAKDSFPIIPIVIVAVVVIACIGIGFVIYHNKKEK